MRISGLVYLNSEGEVQIHKNIIEGQSIYDGSILFGIYYPRSKNQPRKVNKSDFMITPIPFTHWQSSSRLIIQLKRQSDSIPLLTTFLKEHKISILHGVSNRSAHRYSTWDIHISFDEFSHATLFFEDEKSYYKETKEATDDLTVKLLERFGEDGLDLLFKDPKDVDLQQSIVSRLNTALHYFHNITQERLREAEGIDEETLYKPFTLRYSKGNIISNSGRKLGNILNLSKKKTAINRQVPTIGFAESDSHYLNFRIRIIQRNRLENFFKISVIYERHGEEKDTTRGLLDLIMNEFPNDIKVWISSNQLFECRENYGCGKINFFIESPTASKDHITFIQNFKNVIDKLNGSKKPKDMRHISFWPKISPIYPNYIRKHFKNQRASLKTRKRDVFISYSHKDNKQAEKIRAALESRGLTVFKADVEMKAGDQIGRAHV